MANFIETFSQDLSKSQLAALGDLIQRSKSGSAIGEDEAQAIIASIDKGFAPLFKAPTFQSELLDACKLSTALETLRADMSALMDLARALETRMSVHSELQENLVMKIGQAVTRLEELVETNNKRRENPEYTEIKYFGFVNAANESTQRSRAYVDPNLGDLSAGASDIRTYLNRRGDLRPNFNVTVHSSGQDPDSASSFLPEDAIIPDNRYVWAENLLSDGPLSGSYNNIDYDGAVVSLDIEIPQLERINEVKLSPFGNLPMTLVAAEYLDGSEWQSIGLGTIILDPGQRVAFRFEPVDTRSIRLTLVQPHGSKKEFLFEKGQLKKSNWLNIILERSLESTVNDQGTLPRTLLEDRRQRVKAVLKNSRKRMGDVEPRQRVFDIVSDVLAVEDPALVRVDKFEYVVGLRYLEVNYRRYFDTSNYASPPLKATGSIFGVALEVDEIGVDYPDGTGSESPITSVEYQIDVGGGHVFDILPRDITRVESERLDFDANRVGRSRFNVTGSPSVEIRRDSTQLSSGTDYTVSSSVGNKAIVTIAESAWVSSAFYTVSYNPQSGQDDVELLDLFDSIKPTAPEVFAGTSEGNRVSLQAHPFVLTEIARSKQYWTKLDPKDARWGYSFRTTAARTSIDPPYVVRIDGENYGQHPSATITASIAATATSLIVTQAAGSAIDAFPTEGIIKIGTEQIYYASGVTGVVNTFLSGLIRGYNNTTAAAHTMGAGVNWVVLPYYEPINVLVNSVKAVNITNYESGKHPAFSNAGGPPEFVQIGSTLYFDRPITGKIEVRYRRLADYIILRSSLRCHHPSREYTSVVDSFNLNLKTATL